MAKCKYCGAEVQIGQRCSYCKSVAEPMYYSDDVFKHFRGLDEDAEKVIEVQKDIIKATKETRKKAYIEKVGDIEYTVQNGDSLFLIAKKFYGDGLRWREIFEKNKQQINDANRIYPGDVLIIP